MTERKKVYRTDENRNCHGKHKAGRTVVCLVLLWKNGSWNVAWDKLTHVVPYMAVMR